MAETATFSDIRVYGQLTSSRVTIFGEYSLPETDGSTGQVLATNGSGVVSFIDILDLGFLNTLSIQNGTGINWTVTGTNTVRGDVTLAPFSTTNLSEGVNLYFTNERVDDRVSVLIQNGTGINWVYNDPANTLTPTITLAPFNTDQLAQGSTNLYYSNQAVSDFVGLTMAQPGVTGSNPVNPLTWAYIGGGVNTLTPVISLGPFTTDALSEGSVNLYYSDSLVADFLGNVLLQDTATIEWTYNNFLNTLEANYVGTAASISISENGSLVGSQNELNFIAGDNITFNISEDVGNNKIDIQIDSVSVYTADGSLTTNRTVNLNTNDLNIWDGNAAHIGGGTISLGYIKIPEGNTVLNTAGGSPGNGNNLDIIGASNQASIRFFNAPAAHPSGEVVRLGLRKTGPNSQFDILSRGSVVIKTGNAYDGGGISNIILNSHCTGTSATRLPGMVNHTGGLTIATGALCIGTAFTSAGNDNYMRQDGVRGLNISFEQDNGTGITAADRWNNSTSGWEFGRTPILFYNRLGISGGDPADEGSFTFAIGDSANRTDTGAGKREQSDIVLQLSRDKNDDTIDGQLRLPKYGQGDKLDNAPEYILGVTSEGRVKEVNQGTIQLLGTGGLATQRVPVTITSNLAPGSYTSFFGPNPLDFIGSISLPANTLTIGDTYRVTVTGILSTATSSEQIDLSLGLTGASDVINASGLITIPATLTDRPFEFESVFVIRKDDPASSEIQIKSKFSYFETDGGAASTWIFSFNSDPGPFSTGNAHSIKPGVNWGNSGNSITAEIVTIEKIY